MFYMFKKLKILFWVLAILGFILFICSGISVTTMGRQIVTPLIPNIFFSIGLLIIYYICIFIVINKVATDKFEKISNIFFERCDPQKYIEILEKILKENTSHILNTFIRLYLCSAYIALGQNDLSRNILNTISRLPNNRLGSMCKILYYYNSVDCCLQMNDLVKAESILKDFKNFIDNKKFNNKDLYKDKYISSFYAFNIKNGNYSGAEQYYKNKLENSVTMLEKVNTKYILGKTYLHYNKTDEAKRSFEYVVEHGNKINKVQEAKEYLEQLS